MHPERLPGRLPVGGHGPVTGGNWKGGSSGSLAEICDHSQCSRRQPESGCHELQALMTILRGTSSFQSRWSLAAQFCGSSRAAAAGPALRALVPSDSAAAAAAVAFKFRAEANVNASDPSPSCSVNTTMATLLFFHYIPAPAPPPPPTHSRAHPPHQRK